MRARMRAKEAKVEEAKRRVEVAWRFEERQMCHALGHADAQRELVR